ncbi:MAG: hypothetical protein ABW124_13645 [Candidatus Thiodiazotropha sp. 6PLUC9]
MPDWIIFGKLSMGVRFGFSGLVCPVWFGKLSMGVRFGSGSPVWFSGLVPVWFRFGFRFGFSICFGFFVVGTI